MNKEPTITINHVHDGRCLVMDVGGVVTCSVTKIALLTFLHDDMTPGAYRQIANLLEMKPADRAADFSKKMEPVGP